MITVVAEDEGGATATSTFTINVRDALSIVRYFPGSNAGWYRENDDGSRGGAVNVYDNVLNQNTPSRVVIDGNTPPNSQAAASIAFKGGRDSEIVDGANRGLIITAKEIGPDGNNITVEFRLGDLFTNSGVRSTSVVTENNVKKIIITLNGAGATFAEIKEHVETDTTYTEVRDLIDITIADGMDDSRISAAIEETALSDGVGEAASIGFRGARGPSNAEFTDLAGDPDLIITARTAGADGNQITVEFETGSDRRPDVFVTNNNIKIVLPAGGMTLAELKNFIDGDSSAIAVRELISLEITLGREGMVINVDLAATPLSGGSGPTGGRKASIGYDDVQDSEVADVAGDRDLIIAAKTAGENGNGIEVEFEIDGNAIGNGVKSIEVSGRSIKFVLKLGGATLAEIKTFLDDDGSAGAIAARALINIRIADGKDTAEINTAVVATALSGGVAASDAIQENRGKDEFFIKADASSVIIHDPWDKSFIIFDENVIIESIVEIEVNRQGEVVEIPRGQRFPAILGTNNQVTDYIVTLSSGNTITIQDVEARTKATSSGEARYSFLHEGDESLSFRSARSFFNAYKDGFYPDLTQTEITGTATAEVNPNSGYTISGELTVVDPDVPAERLPEIMFVGSSGRSLTGIYGTLTVSRVQSDLSKFTWNYVQDNDDPETIALRDGEKAAERFTLTAGDSEEFVLEITAVGRNDSPVANPDFDVDLTGTVGEAVSINLSGVAIDPDGDALEITVTIFTPSGDPASDLTYNSTDRTITGIPTVVGTYTAQVVVREGLQVVVSKTLSIEIEAQPITGDNTGSVTEDDGGNNSATGTLSALGQTIGLDGANNLGSVDGTYGTMSFDVSSGVWTYTLDNSNDETNKLAENATAEDVFTFSAGTSSHTVTITVSGANDAPVVEDAIEPQSGTVGQSLNIDLANLFSDPDTGDTLRLTFVVMRNNTDVTSTVMHSYTNDILSITPPSEGTYTVMVTASDRPGDSGLTVTSEFTLEAEAQAITGDNTGSVTEDDGTDNTDTGTIRAGGLPIDLLTNDDPREVASSGSVEGTYGVMTLTSSVNPGDGRTIWTWTYVLDNAANNERGLATQALGEGDTGDDVFTFRPLGGGSATFDVTITVNGVNDAPEVDTPIDPQEGRTNQALTPIDLSSLFTDVDGDELTLSFEVSRSGSNVVERLSDIGLNHETTDSTGAAVSRIIGTPTISGLYTIKVIATDGSMEDDGSGGERPVTATSTFNINIVADQPPIIRDAADSNLTSGVGAVMEDGSTLTAEGRVAISDPDGDQTPPIVLEGANTNTGILAGQYGTMAFVEATGTWTYRLDNNHTMVQGLGDGEELTETFTFTALGAENFDVEITITGANDAPTVSGEFINRVGAAGGQFILTNLSDQFTDVDQGDELTFEVTLDDGAALSTIGLTYNSDEDEITGTLTRTGTYVIKIVATDKSGTTVEATFDLSIVPAIPEIQRSSLTYNPDETSITIDETILKVTSGNESDPALLVYTITTLPDAGKLLKSGTQLNDGDTFTQADINNGLITYVPNVSSPSTSQSNPLSFTFSDGVETLEEQTLQITSREVFVDETPAEDNTIDRSEQTTPQKIEAGDGSDTITGGQKDDQIDGGAGDDEIKLTRTVGDVEEDAGADEVLYTFGYDGVGIDGGDEIVGFKRGQDKLTFVVDRNFDSLTEFLQSLNGADGKDLTDDDAFIVTMVWGLDTDGAFYFDGVLLHFKEGTSFGGGRIFSPVVQITFDERLGLHDLIEILGGAENIANNFDGGLTAFKNLDEVLPRLFGEGSIGFKVVAPPSDTSGASERASEEPLDPPIYETLSEQHDDDLQPTSFELGGGETDII